MSTVSLARMPAGSRRFWVAVVCFFILNVIAWVVYDRTFAAAHRGVLRVASFDPGDNAVVDARSTLRWYFSDDVLPTTAYGKDPGRATPAVEGKWVWENPRTLSFIPTADLPRATPVTFTLATELLRTGTGAAMKQPYVTCVRSLPLAVEGVHQSATVDNDQYVLEMKFNDRVAPGDVLQHVTAQLPNGKTVACHLYGQSSGKVVRLVTDPVPMNSGDSETILNLKLSTGLTGFSGPLGLNAVYQTSVNLGKKLMATQMTAYSPTRERAYLLLQFNSGIDLAALKKVLTVEPAIPFVLESDGGQAAILRGDFSPGVRYIARIADLPKGASREEKANTPRPAQLAAFMPDKGADVWFDNEQGYLSSAGNRTIVAHTMNVANLRVGITRMYDNNLVTWRNSANNEAEWVELDSFSKAVAKKTIAVAPGRNIRRDIPICLDDFLPIDAEKSGVWRVEIAAVRTGNEPDDEYEGERAAAAVTMSDIGLTAKRTREGLVVWATSLREATPLEHVRVRVFSSKNQPLGEATTDPQGIARFSNLHPEKDEVAAVLLADQPAEAGITLDGPSIEASQRQADLTWLDLRHTAWELGDSDTSGAAYLRDGQSAYVYSDRGVYRPGETVHLRAIVRSPGEAAPGTAFPVKWQLRRPDLREWKTRTVMLDADGAAAVDIALPADLPSGRWTATLGLPGEDKKHDVTFGSATFLIEDFVPNRLKVGLDLRVGAEKEPRRYRISDTSLDVEVQGDYLFGRPAAGLAVDLSSHAVATPFTPAGWEGWSFGDTANITNAAKAVETVSKPGKVHRKKKIAVPQGDATLVSDDQPAETVALDEHGRYRTSVSVGEIVHLPDDVSSGEAYMGPWLLSTSAGVRETGGRAVTVSRQIAVDALPAYIGIRRVDGQGTAKPGETAEFQIKLVKPDGTPAAETECELQAQLLKQTWNTALTFRDGRYHYDSTRVLNAVKTETVQVHQGKALFMAEVPESGQFVVRLLDASTGALSSMCFYATDGSGWDENVDRQNPEHLEVRVLGAGEAEEAADSTKADTLRQEHSVWRVGQTARVLIASPFKGRLLLSVETDDVVQTQVVEMTSSHMVVPVQVTDACWPNAYITATVIRAIDPNAKWQTHRAFGLTHLNVDSTDRKLQITLAVPDLIRPLTSLDVGVRVTDPAGNPVANAAVTLAAVDEGICSLTDFNTPDPLKFFSAKKALGVTTDDVYGLLMPEVARPDGERAVGGDRADRVSSRNRSPVGAHRVKPVALAWAQVRTDADGIARGSFSLPQFQGKLRVMAVGYTARLLGSVDQGVTVRSPIMAQSSWPRFAAPGDQFSVPIVVFNNSNVGGEVNISIDPIHEGTAGAAPAILDYPTRLPAVPIPAGGQQQVNLRVKVDDRAGVAKVRLTVATAGETFTEDVELPIRPASPMMQFGGVANVSTTQPYTVATMRDLLHGTNTLRVNVTPWPTLNLPQGLDYLDRYPHGCAEQTTSACFPLIALGDIGKQIDPKLFDPQQIKFKIDSGITKLIGMQTADGGLSMWSGQTEPWPWASVYAAHFLTEAKAAGYEVPDEFYNGLMNYVRRLLQNGTDDAGQLELQAYASYVLALAGKPDRSILDRLTELSNLGNRPDDNDDYRAMRGDARLMLSCAWLLSGRRDLAEGLLPSPMPTATTAETPSPRVHRQWSGNLGSPIRDRAMLILAIEQVEPSRAELPELVQQLADCGVKNQWGSTQDVAFSVLAIGRYLRDQTHKTPYDSATLTLGETILAEAASGESIGWNADARSLWSTEPLRVELTGKDSAIGHLSWLQTGVPLSPPKDAEHGLKIHRTYTTLDGKPIGGTVRTGDLVRVELTIEGPPNQPNLVIEDLLPAGLEVENPHLETAAKDDDNADSKPATFGNGRVDMLDDRVVICGAMPALARGHCSYLARAITPGVYTVPPVRAEAMYDLNINALSGAGKLTVLPVQRDTAAAE